MKYYYNRINIRQLFVDFIVVTVLVLGASWANFAHATAGGEGDNTSCNGVGNPNSPCVPGSGGSGGNGGNGGNGGTGGNSTTTNTNQNLNGNTNQNKNNNNNTATGGTGIGLGGTGIASAGSTVTTNTNSNSVAQGGNATGGNSTSTSNGGVQGQNQYQSQSQNANANNAINGSGNGGVSNVEVTNRPAATTASAVPVTVVQSDSCQTGVAVGGQAVAFGVSFSGTRTDENCERIKLWRELRAAGYQKEALLLLMQDKRVADAFAGNKRANNEYEGRDVANLR
jgi:hypothetical protein